MPLSLFIAQHEGAPRAFLAFAVGIWYNSLNPARHRMAPFVIGWQCRAQRRKEGGFSPKTAERRIYWAK